MIFSQDCRQTKNLFTFETEEERIIMIKKGLLLYFLLIAGIVVGQTVKIPISTEIQTRNGKQYYVHTVQKGQTLYSIAKAYHVGLDEIYYANPETRQGILAGQKIYIPTVNKETEITKQVKTSNFDFFYHVATGGETIDHIASIYLIPKRYILLANPGIKSPLKEGEYVKIPVESAFPILEGKTSGKQPVKTYSGGIQPEKPVSPVPVSTKKPLTESHSHHLTQNKPQHTTSLEVSPASGAFNPNIPVIKDYRHVVVAGETLESIAKKYAISVNALKAVNAGLINAFQGERLRLPVTAKVPGYHPSAQELQKALKYLQPAKTRLAVKKKHTARPQHPDFVTHTVKKKETLYSISRQYGLKLQDLYDANPGLSPNIRIGQIIRIPKKKISTDYIYYQVHKKTSLKKIAKLYRININQLFDENPSLGRKVLAGQVVRIPVGARASKLARELEETAAETSPEKEANLPSGMVATTGRCQPRPHNRVFKVALMVPLYLEETDSINMTEFMIRQQKSFAPFRFIEFLEGALVASDSLKSQGMNLELHVYDVDQMLTKTAKVLTRPELKDMDLIIGPFYSRSFSQVALFADHFNIPIVNPLTFRQEIFAQHNNVLKAKPTENVEPSEVMHLIKNNYSRNKVFVIAQNDFVDSQVITALRDSIQKVLPDSVYYPNFDLINIGIAVTQRNKNLEREQAIKDNPDAADSIPVPEITFQDTLVNYSLENQPVNTEALKDVQYDTSAFANRMVFINYARDSLHPFESNASILRKNLVVLYGRKKSYIMDAMNRLNVLRDTFDIQMIGLPHWETMTTLNLYQMDNMQVTYPASYYVDFQSQPYTSFASTFYRRYATVPDRYGILGFDITYYFLNALYQYGNKFLPCLPANRQQGISTQYHFEPADTGNNNFENQYWNWLRIKDKKLQKLPDYLLKSPKDTQEK
jgi:LysM repeat protein